MLKVLAVSSMVIAVVMSGAAHAQPVPADEGVEVLLEPADASPLSAPIGQNEDTTFQVAPAQDIGVVGVFELTELSPSSSAERQQNAGSSTSPSADRGPVPGVGVTISGNAVDSSTMQRIVDRMLQSGVLNSSTDAQDPALFEQAVRAYQRLVGIGETGLLDLNTVGRFLAP